MSQKRTAYDLHVAHVVYGVWRRATTDVFRCVIMGRQTLNDGDIRLQVSIPGGGVSVVVHPDGTYVASNPQFLFAFVDELPPAFDYIDTARLHYVKQQLTEHPINLNNPFMLTHPRDMKKHDFFLTRDAYGNVNKLCQVNSMQRKAGYIEAWVVNGDYVTRFDLNTLTDRVSNSTICHTNKVEIREFRGRIVYEDVIADVNELHQKAWDIHTVCEFFLKRLTDHIGSINQVTGKRVSVRRSRPVIIVVVDRFGSSLMQVKSLDSGIIIVYVDRPFKEIFKQGKVLAVIANTEIDSHFEKVAKSSMRATHPGTPTLYHVRIEKEPQLCA